MRLGMSSSRQPTSSLNAQILEPEHEGAEPLTPPPAEPMSSPAGSPGLKASHKIGPAAPASAYTLRTNQVRARARPLCFRILMRAHAFDITW